MDSIPTPSTINGYYKLSWRERLGFCSGDLAQNLIYQTVSIWLLFYYNNVYGLDATKHKSLGLQTVNFPVTCDEDAEIIMDYKNAADEAGLTIAEVGVWRNTLAADPDERKRWIDYAVRQLRMADAIGAACCVNVVNMITSPQRYFFNDEFLQECFEKLHGTIVSCHLKDILLKQEYTFQLQECACGEGTLDINLYAQLATAENPCMPMIIEHLTTDEEYVASVRYVRERLSNQ